MTRARALSPLGRNLNPDKKRMLENLFSTSFLQLANYIVPLMSLPYIVRIIGPEKYGILALATATMAYFVSVTDFSFSLTATREISENRGDTVRIGKIVGAVYGLKFVLIVLCGAVLAGLVTLVGSFRKETAVFLFSYLFVIGNTLTPQWIFQGLEDMKIHVAMAVGGRVAFLVSLVAIVRVEADYLYVPLLNGIFSITVFLASIAVALRRHHIKLVRPKPGDIREIFWAGKSIFISQFLPNLYNNTSYLILGFSSSNTALGLFAAANKLIDVFISAGYVLSGTFFPILSKKPVFFVKAKMIFLLSGASLSIIAFAAAELLVHMILSDKFLESVPLVRILSGSVFFVFAYLCFSTNYLVIRRFDALVRNISATVSILGLLLAGGLIAWKGEWGAATAIFASRAFLAALSYRFYRKLESQESRQA